MSRWLGWLGWVVLASGVVAAALVRLFLPARLVRLEFFSDPAVLVLILGLLISAPLLAATALARRQARLTAQALESKTALQEEERRRFIQRLDHELKNPLTAIQVQLDNLQDTGPDSSEALAELRAQANRLAMLTRGLRRLSDLETRPLETEPVDVEELLDEVVELLQAPERIEVDVQRVPWEIPPIRGDRELLLVALRNLVENALNYSGSPVQVRARHTAGHLTIEVIDTGRGIPTEEVSLVTEELYRGTNVHDVPGSGLGLSMVQRILERHGGRLDIRSRRGQGTIVTLQLDYAET